MRNTLLVNDGISSSNLPALLIMPFSFSSALRVRHSLLTDSAVVEGSESLNWLSEHTTVWKDVPQSVTCGTEGSSWNGKLLRKFGTSGMKPWHATGEGT